MCIQRRRDLTGSSQDIAACTMRTIEPEAQTLFYVMGTSCGLLCTTQQSIDSIKYPGSTACGCPPSQVVSHVKNYPIQVLVLKKFARFRIMNNTLSGEDLLPNLVTRLWCTQRPSSKNVERGSNYVGNFLAKDSVLMWLAVDWVRTHV